MNLFSVFAAHHGAAASSETPVAPPEQHEEFMSDLSKDVFDPIKTFFGGVLALIGGSSNPAVAAVQSKANDLGSALLSAVPVVGQELANAALATLGPIGVGAEPIADLIIQEACTLLLSKTSNPTSSVAAVTAKVSTPAPGATGTGS